MCFHFQNVLSFSKCPLIFGMCFHFWNVLTFSNVLSFLKCDINEYNLLCHIFFKNTTPPNFTSIFIAVFIPMSSFYSAPQNSWISVYTSLTFHNTQRKYLLHFQKKIRKEYFCWNILSYCISTIEGVSPSFSVIDVLLARESSHTRNVLFPWPPFWISGRNWTHFYINIHI